MAHDLFICNMVLTSNYLIHHLIYPKQGTFLFFSLLFLYVLYLLLSYVIFNCVYFRIIRKFLRTYYTYLVEFAKNSCLRSIQHTTNSNVDYGNVDKQQKKKKGKAGRQTESEEKFSTPTVISDKRQSLLLLLVLHYMFLSSSCSTSSHNFPLIRKMVYIFCV